MTAHDLIAQWFGRPAAKRQAANIRYITVAQLDLLLELIGQDEEGAALKPGRGRSFVWMPSGRDKYVVTEDPAGGRRNTIARMSNIVPSGMGKLF